MWLLQNNVVTLCPSQSPIPTSLDISPSSELHTTSSVSLSIDSLHYIPISPLQNPYTISSSPSITGTPHSVSPIHVVHVHDYEHQSDNHEFNLELLQVMLEVPPLNLHPMHTRSKSGIIKKKALSASLQQSLIHDLSTSDPTSYNKALQVPVWLQAMNEEIAALQQQDTWTLVPIPPDMNLVGCKWVFKVKKNFDGSVVKHKARLVAKGFS